MNNVPNPNSTFTISQMIDLALGNPDLGLGSENINILHYLLHIIVNQLNLENLNVEFKGDECKKVDKLADQNKTLINIHSNITGRELILSKIKYDALKSVATGGDSTTDEESDSKSTDPSGPANDTIVIGKPIFETILVIPNPKLAKPAPPTTAALMANILKNKYKDAQKDVEDFRKSQQNEFFDRPGDRPKNRPKSSYLQRRPMICNIPVQKRRPISAQEQKRHMNHFSDKSYKTLITPPDHICNPNRYCGGSHTITTPIQRVSRFGNFFEVPQNLYRAKNFEKGKIRGTDGKVYVACADFIEKKLSGPISVTGLERPKRNKRI